MRRYRSIDLCWRFCQPCDTKVKIIEVVGTINLLPGHALRHIHRIENNYQVGSRMWQTFTLHRIYGGSPSLKGYICTSKKLVNFLFYFNFPFHFLSQKTLIYKFKHRRFLGYPKTSSFRWPCLSFCRWLPTRDI